jgi:16S rRNA G966 N2-methylase RsmD
VHAVAGRFDLVFADPPYALPYPRAAFATLRSRAAIDARTTVVYEHSARDEAPADPAMPLARSERYGEVALAFLHPIASAA